MAEAVDTCYNPDYVRCDDMYIIYSHCLVKLALQRLHVSSVRQRLFLQSTELTNWTFW